MDSGATFGKEIREKEFSLNKDWTYVNHGSYGMVPNRVLEAQHRRKNEMESRPDHWMRRRLPSLIRASLDAAANFLVCNSSDIVLVENATTAVNCVLKSYPFKESDAILATVTTYGAVQNACRHVVQPARDAVVYFMELSLSIKSEDDILKAYRKMLEKHSNIRLAVIDYITSPTAILMPVKKIVSICKEYNVLTLIDGAHSPGQVHINIKDLGADFYTGNFHKWVFNPRGCAVLYIDKKHQDWCRPVVTGWNFHMDIFHQFLKQGTRDETAFTMVPEAIRFFHDIGGLEKITQYNTDLLDRAVELMTSSLQTERFLIPKELEAPFMRLVRLPSIPGYGTSNEEAERLYFDIADKHNIACLIIPILGHLYVRLSAQVYNTLEDFQKLTDVFVNMAGRQSAGSGS